MTTDCLINALQDLCRSVHQLAVDGTLQISVENPVEAVVLTGSYERGQANIGSDIDIKVTTAAENTPRLTQETDALARTERTSITCIFEVPVGIGIEVSSGTPNGATDAPDDIFLDYEIDVAHLYIYGAPLFMDGMRYAALKPTFHSYCADNLRARRIATALESADQKHASVRSRPGVTDSAAAHEDLTLAERYLFVAGFSYHCRFPVSFEKHLDWQSETILDISDTTAGFKRSFVAPSDPNPNFYRRQETYESLLQ